MDIPCSRRKFLVYLCSIYGIVNGFPSHASQLQIFTGEKVFDRILNKAKAENWRTLPIGELMGKIAIELKGTPYKAKTLELSDDREVCSVNLDGLDCVTFFETTLDLARIIKAGSQHSADLLKAVEFTRYRGGRIGDFTSRLHYTSDWLHDNEAKHVVKILSNLPGAETPIPKVKIMSSEPGNYPQLIKHPDLVSKIQKQENAINKRGLKYVPTDKIAAIEPLLKTGDIVGACTNFNGLDIAHTGIVFRTEDGVAHFMDASSKKGEVTIEADSISKALSRSKSWTGAIFARPLEPSS